MNHRKRYPENAPGHFYVEADSCIRCGTLSAVAPDLVEMNEKTLHFKKQPSTQEEFGRAIRAVNFCCCEAYRDMVAMTAT